MSTPYEPTGLYAIRQFELERLVPLQLAGLDMSITNSSSAMISTALVIMIAMAIAFRRPAMVPGRKQAAVEIIYEFVAGTVTRTAGPAAIAHVPFVFSLFVLIFFGTLFGLTPLKFTFTSHLVVTFSLALIVFAYVVALGFKTHGSGFLGIFRPEGTPGWLAPLIVLVEVISFLFRPVTLGVRLFVNVLAGHMIIKLFGDFCVMMIDAFGSVGILMTVGPIVLMMLFFAFEIVVVFLQSYIFMLLTCVYIRSSLEGH